MAVSIVPWIPWTFHRVPATFPTADAAALEFWQLPEGWYRNFSPLAHQVDRGSTHLASINGGPGAAPANDSSSDRRCPCHQEGVQAQYVPGDKPGLSLNAGSAMLLSGVEHLQLVTPGMGT